MMEVVGDYSENPFQGMANDIPMLSLSRLIEIDLREMIYETNWSPATQANEWVLM
ncbi:MAG: putative membrane protein [Chitinophagales bacterium]|jgi:putative membrane protein